MIVSINKNLNNNVPSRVPKHFCLKSGAYEKMNFEKRSISDKLFENGKREVAGCRLKVAGLVIR